jgi:hypothetical protein
MVDLFCQTSSSLRCLSPLLAVLRSHLGLDCDLPAFSTIRSWLLRFACYQLVRPLDQDSRWVWIVDHTFSIAGRKLLVIVGVRLAAVPWGIRALALSDLSLVALVPMTESNGPLVQVELEKAVERTGVPAQIVSDQGTDLLAGLSGFVSQHPQTRAVADVAHVGANILQNRWEKQERWQSWTKRMSQTNRELRPSPDAALLSPKLRTQSRFMNVGPVLRFAVRLLGLLLGEKPSEKVKARYGWMLEYEQQLRGWNEEYEMVQKTIRQVRVQGLSEGTLAELEKQWGEESEREGTRMVRGHLRAYVRRQVRGLGAKEKMVGSSEVLESAFGKLKAKLGECQGGELTALTVTLGAMLGKQEEEQVRQALESVPEKKAEGMIERLLGKSLSWLRRQLFGSDKSGPVSG